MKDINILITGGSGNIGSSLLEGLLKFNEYKVTVVDNLSTGSFSKIKKFQKDINFLPT
jgi:UDP-glucose 4-epimerase